MIQDDKIDYEFRIVGDRRGGQHAVIQWMFTQFNGIIFRKNNAFSQHDIFKLSGFPDLKKFKAWSKNIEKSFTASVVNYEEKSLDILEKYGYKQYSKERYDIIILRDPYNLFSSKIKAWKVGEYDINKFQKQLNSWIEKAKQVLNKESYFINYNRWFCDTDYRKEILTWFPKGSFTFTDEYKEVVPKGFGGSAFDGRKFNKEAEKMNVLNRYRGMEEHFILNLVIKNKEVVSLSDKIFGKIIG